ncbi:hypothetical protein BGW80DRAFT_1291575 [Lactifluus volemus]|nr:hypothetical protein BGW80DRAFT_1291575 [Lactifluus volemus]
MPFIDVFSLFLSILGVYGLILYLRFLIPRYIIQPVSVQLSDTQRLLAHAESIGAIPEASQLRIDLEMYETLLANELTRMRMESHRAHGIFQQLRLAVCHGLTWKLYVLSSQIEVIRVKVEVCSFRALTFAS